MKKLTMLFAAALFAVGVSAQNVITVDQLNPFSGIQANGNRIELFVTQNPDLPLSMTVDMNGNDPNHLRWWETDGMLQIKYMPKNREKPIIIKLNVHTLEKLDLQGSSMTMETPWNGHIVTVNLSNSAKLTAEIYAKDLMVNTQSSATAVIKGESKYADYDTRLKSVLDARNYTAQSTSLRAGGYSEAYVYGTERIVIEALDGATVFKRGNPEIYRERTTRGGHVNYIGN